MLFFCYPCRLFTTRSGKAEAAFILTGFHDWNHASGKQGVVLHDKCAIHKGAVLSREECKRNAACGPSLASQLVAGWDLVVVVITVELYLYNHFFNEVMVVQLHTPSYATVCLTSDGRCQMCIVDENYGRETNIFWLYNSYGNDFFRGLLGKVSSISLLTNSWSYLPWLLSRYFQISLLRQQ